MAMIDAYKHARVRTEVWRYNNGTSAAKAGN
jgi:hypothetical protein